jgi:hypothetical protein
MNCMELFENLEAYHSGTLSRDQAEAVEQHLLACEDCRADFRFQRTLRTETAALAREITPESDLWTGIQSRLGPPRGALTGRTQLEPPRWWQRKGFLAAAAVILMAMTSALTLLLVRPRDSVIATDRGGDFRITEAAYQQAAAELAQTLETRRNELSPAALAVIEHNLRIIDEAIREAEAALAEDPRNQDVAGLLWATYEKKIDLLQRAAQHAES